MRRLLYAGACVSLRMACMVGLVRHRSIDGLGGWLTSVTPQPETRWATSGTLPLGRYTNAPIGGCTLDYVVTVVTSDWRSSV